MHLISKKFMADIAVILNAPKSGKPVRKQLPTHVDLTPMVDLGFLLITFFIFTTTLAQPSVLKLNLPQDGPPSVASEDKTLTLVPGSKQIGFYKGADAGEMQFTDYSPAGIRKEIIEMKRQIARHFGNSSQLYIVIKPTVNASYQNIVTVLDEMLINNVTRYVLTEADKKENEIVKE